MSDDNTYHLIGNPDIFKKISTQIIAFMRVHISEKVSRLDYELN